MHSTVIVYTCKKLTDQLITSGDTTRDVNLEADRRGGLANYTWRYKAVKPSLNLRPEAWTRRPAYGRMFPPPLHFSVFSTFCQLLSLSVKVAGGSLEVVTSGLDCYYAVITAVMPGHVVADFSESLALLGYVAVASQNGCHSNGSLPSSSQRT